MRLARVRFTMQEVMLGVVIAACASQLANSMICRACPDPGTPIVAVVAAAFGFGAMRHPGHFLFYLIVMSVVAPPSLAGCSHPIAPHTYHSNIFELLAAGCCVGWIIGAPAGMISRYFTRLDDATTLDSVRPEPKRIEEP